MYQVIFEVFYGFEHVRPVFKSYFVFPTIERAISFCGNIAEYEVKASAPANGHVHFAVSILPR